MCTCCALPTWWSWRGGCTRSHSEHGRETPQRRWYFVSRRGRVGRCQVCKSQHQVDIFSIYEIWNTHGSLSRPVLPFALHQQTARPVAGVEQPQPNRRSPAPRIGKTKTGHARKLRTYRGVEQPPPTHRGQRPRGPAKQRPGMSGSSSLIAGWSSPVARQAHNLKVAGSNPAPATK